MQRRFEQIDTEFGTVTVKINQYGSITKKTLEYEDCQRIAKDAVADSRSLSLITKIYLLI